MHERFLSLIHTEISRRTLLRGAAGAALIMPVGASLSTAIGALAADLPNDIAVLNFALTLEHLEARAYRDALASGKLTGRNVGYTQAYGAQEADHVKLLSQAITAAGGTPVAPRAAYTFPAFTDEAAVIGFLRVLEETGVAAYNGAARFIADRRILAVAAGINQVEARHAAILRRQDGMPPVPSPVETILTPDQTLAVAKPILG